MVYVTFGPEKYHALHERFSPSHSLYVIFEL